MRRYNPSPPHYGHHGDVKGISNIIRRRKEEVMSENINRFDNEREEVDYKIRFIETELAGILKEHGFNQDEIEAAKDTLASIEMKKISRIMREC